VHTCRVYERPDEIQGRMDHIAQYFDELGNLANVKQGILDQRLLDEVCVFMCVYV